MTVSLQLHTTHPDAPAAEPVPSKIFPADPDWLGSHMTSDILWDWVTRRSIRPRWFDCQGSGLVKSADLLTPSEPDAGSSGPDGNI